MRDMIVGFHYIKIQSKNPNHYCCLSEGKESKELIYKCFSQIRKEQRRQNKN